MLFHRQGALRRTRFNKLLANPTPRVPIGPDERAHRQEAVDYGRGSVRLVGLVMSDYAGDLNRRYIEGDIPSAERSAASRLAKQPDAARIYPHACLGNGIRFELSRDRLGKQRAEQIIDRLRYRRSRPCFPGPDADWIGSRAAWNRCFTVAPACATPSNLGAASNRIGRPGRLLKRSSCA